MADDVMRKAAAEAQAAPKGATLPARPESRADRARRLVYRGRFAVFYFLLAVAAGFAVGALLVLVGRGSPAPPPAWSAWEPTGSAGRRAAQIGEHVSDAYRLPSGNALAAVTYAGPPMVTGPDGSTFQVRALAVRPDASGGRAEADAVDTINASTTVMYTLCGLGEACSIPEGQPSLERAALLRRQAMELALYTFTYIDDMDSIVALLPPPRADGEGATAVFLERSDVKAELGRPIGQTLTSPVPELGATPAEELRTIDRVTRSRVYEFTYLQAQDGSPVMVFTPALGS